MQLVTEERRALVERLIQIYEGRTSQLDGEVSNEKMLVDLHQLLASMPVPSAPSPPPQSPSPAPQPPLSASVPNRIILAFSDDEDSEDNASLDNLSDFIVNDDEDGDESDEDYYPSLDVRDTEISSASDSDYDADFDGITDSDIEIDCKSETDVVPSAGQDVDMDGQSTSGADNVETAMTTVLTSERVGHSEILDDVLVLTDSEDESNPYFGIGNCVDNPITLE